MVAICIHNNPVEAGWVHEPYEFYYSSARYYSGLDSPFKIYPVYYGNNFTQVEKVCAIGGLLWVYVLSSFPVSCQVASYGCLISYSHPSEYGI